MPRKFSLYPPTVALVTLCVGVGMVSVPAALIVGGGLMLAAWVAYFVADSKARAKARTK